MHEILEGAERDLRITLPNLRTADSTTEKALTSAKKKVAESLSTYLGDESTKDVGLDIYAFGSMARREMGKGSDFDFLVVANDLGPDPRTINHFRQAAADAFYDLRLKSPGASGLFGGVVAAPDLVNVIGLNEDSNMSMSRRILVLQESVVLNNENRRALTVRAIINRYLVDYRGNQGSLVPRFLLNDIVRFWRTVAVDYQAKRWHEMKGEKWGLRYIKLRSSRKWAFAGNFVAILMPVIAGKPTTGLFLSDQFEMPALARIAQLSKYVEPAGRASEALSEVLTLADWFVGQLAVEEWRALVEKVDDPTDHDAPQEFKDARQKSGELQRALERLFFCDEPLAGSPSEISLQSLSTKYLSF